jgi:hypothetical protein
MSISGDAGKKKVLIAFLPSIKLTNQQHCSHSVTILARSPVIARSLDSECMNADVWCSFLISSESRDSSVGTATS